MKRLFAILSIVVGIVMFLLACSKSSHDTLAFVGDESDMKSSYDIYPKEYFPYTDIFYDTLMFPPDITGEYEMTGTFVNGYYEYYNANTHQYVPYPSGAYPVSKAMNFIIEDQVNGMAIIKFRLKNNDGNYQPWQESEAYIFGNVFAKNNNRDFLICFDSTEDPKNGVVYYRGNILKGTITDTGIQNLERWSVIKDRNYSTLLPYTLNVGGYEHYHADLVPRNE